MYYATQGCTQKGIQSEDASYVYWKMMAYQNVTLHRMKCIFWCYYTQIIIRIMVNELES